MLLYAGKASISSFKYFIFLDIVKNLKQWSQSAGNTFRLKSVTSETICDNTENIKNISIHVPTYLKPLNDEQFGHYLAGLIDGGGYFSYQQQLVILFSFPDVQLAYYIKKRIGFGFVKKFNKNAYLYVISNKDGIIKVINLINGKLRTFNIFNQVINNILAHSKFSVAGGAEFELNISNGFYNHWIAGFSDASSSFKIQLVTKTSQTLPHAPVVTSGAKGVGINMGGDNTHLPKALPETRLVVWGQNLTSSVGLGRFTKQVCSMIRIPAYQQSVITGLILSDGWLTFGSKTSKSARLGFKQSLSHSDYFWFVFSLLSPYCSTMPGFISSTWRDTKIYALHILTRSLPCFTELYATYYSNGIKRIPADIFNLLTPVALAHWICGDGAKNRHGLTISTESYSVNDAVLLLNVLIVKYGLDCSIRKHYIGYNIYIKEKSMSLLRTIVQPHMHSSMLYRLRIDTDVKDTNKVDDSKKHLEEGVFKPTTSDTVISSCSKIKKFDPSNSFEVRLNFQIVVPSENHKIVLLFKDYFGGLLSYNNLNDEYTYSSSSYGSAWKIIKYFDVYHLQSTKHIDFLRWRKSYILAAKGDYSGISKYYKVLGPSLKKNEKKNSSAPTLS